MNMLNKKGFTLVELLATIIILGIISTMAVISIDAMMEEAQVKECEAIATNLKTAVKEFVSDRRYDSSFGNPPQLQIKYLVNNGYFSNNVTNPFTNKQVDHLGEYQVDIIYLDNGYVDVIVSDVIECKTKHFFPKI